MKNFGSKKQVLIILAVFLASRIITGLFGLHMNMWALSAYWQYLDIETLKTDLLRGVWYDHAQPPAYNLFLGFVLKMSGNHALSVFTIILKLISLFNALLLWSIVRKITSVSYLPLFFALAYLISPATLIFECELFYTTAISFLLLVSVNNLIVFGKIPSWQRAFGFIIPLVFLCFTRSVYHIFWLILVCGILLFYYKGRKEFRYLILTSFVGILLVGGWYLKNQILFGKFTTSTWIGMNMARNVFHDNEIKDSSRIEAYAPFSKISVYRKFVDPDFEKKYKGFNDRDLLQEIKNDSFINESEISYIPVSDLYQKASIAFIRSHPRAYIQNVLQSGILYFTPATMYSLADEQSVKIKPYDIIYSFNLTHFAKGKQQRRILLTISAIPKLIIYFLVVFIFVRSCLKYGRMESWNVFILITIGFIFMISSFFEHYENMRFRFETEPFFLILAAQVSEILIKRFRRNL